MKESRVNKTKAMSQNQTATLSVLSQQTADELTAPIWPERLQYYFTKVAGFLLFSRIAAGLVHSMFSYENLCRLSL